MAMVQQYTDVLKELEVVKAQRDEHREHLAVIAEMTGNKGDIGAAHEGVNALVEEIGRCKRMFAAACESLGEVQQALGNSVVGIEAALVKDLVKERDALTVHAQRLTLALDNVLHETGAHATDDHSQDEKEALAALASVPTASLNRFEALKQAEAFEAALAAIDADPQNARQMIEGMLVHSQRQAEGEAHE